MVIFDFWLLFGTNMFTRFQNLALFSELVLADQNIFDDLPKSNGEEDQSFSLQNPVHSQIMIDEMTLEKLYFMTWTYLKLLGVKLPHLRYNNVLLWKNTLMADWTCFFSGRSA